MTSKEEEIQLLEQLIKDLTIKLNKLKESNETEYFLTRQLRSFPDFPNIKYGDTWGYIEKRLNIYTVNDLIHSYPEQLMTIRSFGKGRLRDLEEWMKKYNLFFLRINSTNDKTEKEHGKNMNKK